MNSFLTLKGKIRKKVGKIYTKKLRTSKKVPCVIYGDNCTQNIHFYVTYNRLHSIIYTNKIYKIFLELEDYKKIETMIKDVQFHPVSDIILHVDFFQLNSDKYVILQIPINIVGISPGIIKGGLLHNSLRKLKVKALPNNLPDSIVIDITNLDIGDRFLIKNIKSELYELLYPVNTVILSIKSARKV